MKMKKVLFLSVISLLSLAGCGRTAESSSSEEPKSEPSSSVSESQPAESSSEPESTSVPESSSSEPESIPSSEPAPIVDNEVSVFLLSGQSNMQGNSSSSATNLSQAFEDLGFDDYEEVSQGIENVYSSVYCAGYGELNHENLVNNSRLQSYTNKEDQFAGKFIPTVPGLGNFNGTSGSNMGPEFGCAYALKDYADEDHPIFLVKMASNGSGFAQSGTQYNWPVKNDAGEFPEINLYDTFAKPFLLNNLALIEEMGYTPVIKGWLWHQGESDCDGGVKTASYAQRLGDMVAQFREDFAEYARDEDGENIAFIDGMVYQGSGTAWTKPQDMNAQKQEFADSADNNYLVDIYGNEEDIPENELKPGQPGGDSMHYNTKSSLRLGIAYGNVIIDNDLLD
ncbi:MAG: hypothetical protein J6X50_02355 [Bacilli bacterium]|nr:hypothetical protein [Bacilli bacterium]